jgi:AcrR family transcriptional regulator
MPAKLKPLKATPAPLPRGRHGLSARVVRASQRERLIGAMLELVSGRGYAATTVPEVVALARVSRNAFYEFFSDKEECFLAACESESAGLIPDMVGLAPRGNWVDALNAGMDVYLNWWQQRPELTRAYFIELPLSGTRATRQRDRAYQAYVKMFSDLGKRVRKEQPRLAPLPGYVPLMLAVSITEYVAAEVRQGGVGRLGRLKGDLVHYTVKLLADDATAQSSNSSKDTAAPC